MAENSSRDGKSEAAEGLRAILQRIAGFFDIFDLSLIVSGAVTLAAFAFLDWRVHWINFPVPEGWLYAVALILASYVLGLLCFVLGRWLRERWRWRRLQSGSNDLFRPILNGHGLSDTAPFSDYYERGGGAELYTRLWAEVRGLFGSG